MASSRPRTYKINLMKFNNNEYVVNNPIPFINLFCKTYNEISPTSILKNNVMHYVIKDPILKPNLKKRLLECLIRHCNINMLDENQDTPLMCAIELNNYPLIVLLLKNNANPDIGNLLIYLVNKYTKLHPTDQKTSNIKGLIMLLLKHGADINKKDKDKKIAMNYAFKAENGDMIQFLFKNGAIHPLKTASKTDLVVSIHNAIIKNELNDIKTLLTLHSSLLESKDDFGNTPLNSATIQKKYEIVEYLLKKGADINTQHRYGGTPLLVAVGQYCEPQNPERDDYIYYNIAELLLKKQVNPNIGDINGTTPLIIAARTLKTKRENPNIYELADLLIKHGANLNHQDISGSTALMFALMQHNDDMIDLLMNYYKSFKYDINIQNNDNTTALALAVFKPAKRDKTAGLNKLKLIETMFELGASPIIIENHPGFIFEFVNDSINEDAVINNRIIDLLTFKLTEINIKHSLNNTSEILHIKPEIYKQELFR